MSRRDPLVYVHHMLDHSAEAWGMVQGRSRADLDTDRMLNLALVRLMEIVGEASRRVSQEFRPQYPDDPWRETSDLRNRLIHGYDEINFDVLWDIIRDELPPLIEQLEEIVYQHEHPTG